MAGATAAALTACSAGVAATVREPAGAVREPAGAAAPVSWTTTGGGAATGACTGFDDGGLADPDPDPAARGSFGAALAAADFACDEGDHSTPKPSATSASTSVAATLSPTIALGDRGRDAWAATESSALSSTCRVPWVCFVSYPGPRAPPWVPVGLVSVDMTSSSPLRLAGRHALATGRRIWRAPVPIGP